MHIRILSAFLLLASLSAPRASAEEVSIEQRCELLRARLEQERQDRHIPGMAFALVKDDQVLMAEGFGLRDVDAERPVTAETLFAIGSTTKAFTSMLLAMHKDAGQADWDDPVRRHIPFFALHDEKASEQVTLRDLLCHRTGLCRQSMLWYANLADRETVLRHVVEAEPTQPFRSRFQYNNVMYLAAGYAAGQLADCTWDELLERRIFAPLGMDRSTTSVAEMEGSSDHSRPYAVSGEEATAVPVRDITACGPAGSIFSSANDMSRWLRFLLKRGEWQGEQLVQAARFDEMWEDQKLPASRYGLGWFLQEWQGKKVVEHGGNIDGFAAEVGLMPEENLGFVLLTNVGFTPLQQGILPLVWDAMLGDKPGQSNSGTVLGRPGPALSAAEVAAYEGTYLLRVANQEAKVAFRDGQLRMRLAGQPWVPLAWPDREGRWALQGVPNAWLVFDRTETGYIAGATLHQGAEMQMPRVEQEEPLPLTIDELLEVVAGGHGGLAAEELPPLYLEGAVRLVNQGVTAQLRTWVDGLERMVHQVDYGPFGHTLLVRDGSRAWQITAAQGFQDLGDELGPVMLYHPGSAYGDWWEVFDDLEVVRKDEIDGRPVYIVKGVFGDAEPIIRSIDVDSARLVQEQGGNFGWANGASLITYEDFRDVAGVQIPFRSRYSSPGHGETVQQYERFELGVEAPAELLVRPEG